MKDDSILLARICDSAQKIMRAMEGRDETSFAEEEIRPAAVILWLTQIGEIAKRLSEETKEKYKLPWKDITGFRDMAVHEYFELSIPDVYLTATKDIPDMLNALSGR